jgi:hypothetical protein
VLFDKRLFEKRFKQEGEITKMEMNTSCTEIPFEEIEKPTIVYSTQCTSN